MLSSRTGVSVGELAEVCRALAASHLVIDSDVEQEQFSALVRMTIGAHPSRRATVSASLTGWIELSIDGSFGIVQLDEDATAEEFRKYIADYIELGVSYLHHGAREQKSRLLRVPMQVLDPERGRRGIAQLTTSDALRYVWRRMWSERQG